MRIIVDKLPLGSSKCLFKKYYNEKYDHWTCGLNETNICSLDSGMECPYLCEAEENIRKVICNGK